MDIPGFIVGLVRGLLGLGVDAVGAVMGFLATAIQALAMVASRVVDLLPDAADLGLTVPSGFIYGYTVLNTFLPITEALGMVAVLVVIHLGVLTYHVAVTVYHLIPKPMIGT